MHFRVHDGMYSANEIAMPIIVQEIKLLKLVLLFYISYVYTYLRLATLMRCDNKYVLWCPVCVQVIVTTYKDTEAYGQYTIRNNMHYLFILYLLCILGYTMECIQLTR